MYKYQRNQIKNRYIENRKKYQIKVTDKYQINRYKTDAEKRSFQIQKRGLSALFKFELIRANFEFVPGFTMIE